MKKINRKSNELIKITLFYYKLISYSLNLILNRIIREQVLGT